MQKFIRDVVLFCGINLAILGYLYAIYDVPNDYLASVNDKLDRLETSEPPRLLLVGGSSVAWGTHSAILEQELSTAPTNLGYHAAVGLNVRIEEAKQLARKGDIAVLSIEWSVFKDEPWARKLTETTLASPRSLSFMNVRDRKLVVDGMLPAMRMPFVAVVDDGKDHGIEALTHASAQRRKKKQLRENFNEYGDYEGHYDQDPVGIDGKVVRLPSLEELEIGVERLNQLNTELNSRGVQVFYFLPIIPSTRFEQDRDRLTELLAVLSSQLEIPILNPDDFLYPENAFFDSCYHLRKESGIQRTKLMAERLRAAIDGAKP